MIYGRKWWWNQLEKASMTPEEIFNAGWSAREAEIAREKPIFPHWVNWAVAWAAFVLLVVLFGLTCAAVIRLLWHVVTL